MFQTPFPSPPAFLMNDETLSSGLGTSVVRSPLMEPAVSMVAVSERLIFP